MKTKSAALTQFFVALAGGIVVSQAVSFGWYSEAAKVGSVLRNHSVILFAAGIGLLAASYFIRQSSARMAVLEQQLALLQQRKG